MAVGTEFASLFAAADGDDRRNCRGRKVDRKDRTEDAGNCRSLQRVAQPPETRSEAGLILDTASPRLQHATQKVTTKCQRGSWKPSTRAVGTVRRRSYGGGETGRVLSNYSRPCRFRIVIVSFRPTWGALSAFMKWPGRLTGPCRQSPCWICETAMRPRSRGFVFRTNSHSSVLSTTAKGTRRSQPQLSRYPL